MTIVGYSRALPGDVDGEEASALKAAGAARVFVASASAGTWDRSPLEECLKQLVAGDVLVVTDASRLTPSLSQFVSAVARLDERGVRFRSLQNPALSTDQADVPASAAEVMRELDHLRHRLRSIRTREGQGAAAAIGRRPGRPTVMTSERIAMARELRSHERSIAHIARVIGVSRSAVQRVLEEPN